MSAKVHFSKAETFAYIIRSVPPAFIFNLVRRFSFFFLFFFFFFPAPPLGGKIRRITLTKLTHKVLLREVRF